ncbi:hypothetical protein [Ramlibacter sp.]|uniref:hypothetical protein n=1 Tax=Ramlibacter sp. TaxID=1917967 RepID=UPI002D47E6AF|nr:hypothetical protein [Ramlibacter sp.]HYD77153.1 hypothetical protein [Ramlibacter sp.]
MIFALCASRRTLLVFGSDAEAIAHAEDVDLQAGGWQFFDASGAPLQVVTAGDHPRCFFVAPDTLYLRPAGGSVQLEQLLGEVDVVQGPPSLGDVAAVRAYLTRPLPKTRVSSQP